MSKPDIGIIYPNYFPESFGEHLMSDFGHEKLNLDLRPEEPQVWASLEWAIPGIIAAFIFKSYFESFLKEAGKDHYQLLKKSLTKLLKSTKDLPVETRVSDGAINKLDKSNTQSKAVSIHVELKNGRMMKLMFDNDLEIEDWLGSLDVMLNMLDKHYSNESNDNLTYEINKLENKPHREVYAVIDKNTKSWVFLDMSEILKQKQLKKNS